MNIEREVALMAEMTVNQLREKYENVFGETTRTGNKQWLIKRIAWRLQANALGGLSERAKRRAAELANDADVRVSPPKGLVTIPIAPRANVVGQGDPMPGTVITRVYKGKELRVLVEADGYVFQGEKFKSLTALAKHITGSHCSGKAFFKVRKPK